MPAANRLPSHLAPWQVLTRSSSALLCRGVTKVMTSSPNLGTNSNITKERQTVNPGGLQKESLVVSLVTEIYASRASPGCSLID